MSKIPEPVQHEMDALCDRANNTGQTLLREAGVCILSLKTERDQLKVQINRFKTGVEVMSECGTGDLLYEIDEETPAESMVTHNTKLLKRLSLKLQEDGSLLHYNGRKWVILRVISIGNYWEDKTMNLQYIKHNLAMKVFRGCAVVCMIAGLLWGANAWSAPKAYEPAPKAAPAPTQTFKDLISRITGGCSNLERFVLVGIEPDGAKIYHTFYCRHAFSSKQPPNPQ